MPLHLLPLLPASKRDLVRYPMVQPPPPPPDDNPRHGYTNGDSSVVKIHYNRDYPGKS